jgi:polar amino acid transport system substrate-binding protein
MNMRRIGSLTAIALATAAPLSAWADRLDDIMSSKQIVCGVQAATPPFGFSDPTTRIQVGHDVDLCKAIAAKLGVTPQIRPLSTEGKVPEIKLGHVDIGVANLAYTRTRGEQVQFSDPYYITRETLVVPAAKGTMKLADFKGQRISTSKGSTSELAVKLQGGIAITFQDPASAYLSVIQNKAVGFVNNEMTARQYIQRAAESGVKLAAIEEPMALEPISVGMQHEQPQLLARINGILAELEKDGQMDVIWNKWIGPGTTYNMVRKDKVQPMTAIAFEPLP